MKENIKPTSKVIQISAVRGADDTPCVFILRENGSVDIMGFRGDGRVVIEAPEPASPILPMPGSWWQKINGKGKYQVSGVYGEGPEMRIIVSYCDEDDLYDEELQTFMTIFKPLEVVK